MCTTYFDIFTFMCNLPTFAEFHCYSIELFLHVYEKSLKITNFIVGHSNVTILVFFLTVNYIDDEKAVK